MQCGVFGAVCALVIGIYVFAAQSGQLEAFSLNAADTYYNLLVQGFRAGQLSLKAEVPPGLAQSADPYDPKANAFIEPASNSMIDMSYYKGKLYLYFGVTPALILFWPYAVLTKHYLFHRQAVAIFCAVGFLASAGLLRAMWRRYFDEVSVWVVAACMLALGLATGLPVLMSRSDVYEVPISCGYMLTMLALGAIWCALHEPPRHRMSGSGWLPMPGAWLAAASAAYGLAVGARPSLVFGAVNLLVPVVLAWRQRRPVWGLLAAATLPILVIGLGLMLYNALRFENPFEFGLRYELGPARMDRQQLFSLPYFWFNSRVYFLEPARWSSRFPFVHQIVVPPLPLGRGQVETAYGVLTNIPLVWLALAAPLAWHGRSPRLSESGSTLRGFLAAVALVFGLCALVLCLFRGANFRYEVDFLPALVLLAVVGILGLERVAQKAIRVGRPIWWRAVRGGWGLLLGFSVAFNLLTGIVNCAESHCYMASALSQAGKFQEAMAHCEQALRMMPEHAEAHNNLGFALALAGRIQEAIGHYEQALRIKPDFAGAHNNLGIAFEQLGRMKEAIREYEQALRIKPDYAAAHNSLGVALSQVGQLDDAIRHYEQAVRIKPDFAEAHYDLGDALVQRGRVQEGIGHCEQALRLKPEFAEPHNSLGVALSQVGQLDDAIRHYEQALRIKPDYAIAHYNLGTALEQAGRIQEAIEHYRRALEINPEFVAAKNRLARLSVVQ